MRSLIHSTSDTPRADSLKDIVSLRRQDVNNAREFGTAADVAAAKLSYRTAVQALHREWDARDAAYLAKVMA